MHVSFAEVVPRKRPSPDADYRSVVQYRSGERYSRLNALREEYNAALERLKEIGDCIELERTRIRAELLGKTSETSGGSCFHAVAVAIVERSQSGPRTAIKQRFTFQHLHLFCECISSVLERA